MTSNIGSMNKVIFKYVNGKQEKYISGQNVHKSIVQQSSCISWYQILFTFPELECLSLLSYCTIESTEGMKASQVPSIAFCS